MTWTPGHPGGLITCDAPGCTHTRRSYCDPAERDRWTAYGHEPVRDLCPTHNIRTQSGEPADPPCRAWAHGGSHHACYGPRCDGEPQSGDLS